jgi:putative glutamine amidotransferase
MQGNGNVRPPSQRPADRNEDDRPWIGIAAAENDISWDGWNKEAVFVPSSYSEAVRRSGGFAVLIPPRHVRTGLELKKLDGLLLAGGPDISPENYGRDRDPRAEVPSSDRDVAELALVREALAADMPVFAICRGLEILNVALGGTLLQHLPDRVGHDGHLSSPNEFVEHAVTLGDLGIGQAGSTNLVFSYHHQAIDVPGAGLEACAWAPDGTIEAVRHETKTWIIGVLWHPEAGHDLSLFEAFVGAAQAYRDRSGAGAAS